MEKILMVICRICILLWSITAMQSIAQAQRFDAAPETLRVMTWNVEWMFDHYTGDNRSKLSKEQSAPSREYWESRLAGVTKTIADAGPEIVALQEIEGDQTLAAIVRLLKSKHKISYRYAFIKGSDSFTEQDVGILVRNRMDSYGLTSYRRHEQSKSTFGSHDYYNLSKHLVAEFRWSNVDSPLTVMNIHLRATEKAEDKRVRQARLARFWLEPELAAGEDVILLGDLNSEHQAGQLLGDIAEIVGSEKQPKMVDLLTQLPDSASATHLILDKQFDRILVSQSLMEDGEGLDWHFEKIEILREANIRGKQDGQEHWHERLTMDTDELDLSDHFPVLATFQLQ